VRLRADDDDAGATGGREVVFVPPDGEFELMRYRSGAEGARPPLKLISSVVQHGRARVELVVLLRAQVPASAGVFDTRVRLPVPRVRVALRVAFPFAPTRAHASRLVSQGTAGVTFRTGGGARSRAKWLRAEDVVQWKIPELPGGGEVRACFAMRFANASPCMYPLAAFRSRTRPQVTINVAVDVVPSTRADARWAPPPATLSFSVPGHSATGLRVRALRVQEKGGYKVTKWVRYALISGAYEARLT
jgi:AP-2 complex subunit mu-1